jgi:predicted nucleic acid-binding protein
MPMSSFGLNADILISPHGLRRTGMTHGDEDPKIAAITVAKLWHGVERATHIHKRRREDYLQMIRAALPIVPYTETTALEHARIWAELESSGQNDRLL